MNEMAEAFAELTEAKREVTGNGDVVILDGRQLRTSLVEEITTEEVIVNGGRGEAGGYRVHAAMSELSEAPAKGTDIAVNGNHLEVLSVIERNRATYEIVAGSIASEDE